MEVELEALVIPIILVKIIQVFQAQILLNQEETVVVEQQVQLTEVRLLEQVEVVGDLKILQLLVEAMVKMGEVVVQQQMVLLLQQGLQTLEEVVEEGHKHNLLLQMEIQAVVES